MKKTVSDILAWLAFSALVLWIAAVALTITSYWQVLSDVMALVDEVKTCASNQCESQVFFERFSSTTTAFGFNTDHVKSVRMPAFATWLIIIIFQSFFVRSFRVWPWQTNPRLVGRAGAASGSSGQIPPKQPIKVITLLTRKPGLTKEEFRNHYENVHRHLGEKYLFPHAIKYVRRYVEAPSGSSSYEAAPDFDVIMEVWFPNKSAMSAAMQAINSPEAQQEILADEENLFDRGATKSFTVNESNSS